MCLQQINGFERPKVQLEQYETRPHIAARILHTIQATYEDIEGNSIADLGCGCGTFTIGSALLDAQYCLGFDIDPDALQICLNNCDELDEDDRANIDLIQVDAVHEFALDRFHKAFDTVIMNPPFGTKSNKGKTLHFVCVKLIVLS